MTTDDSTFKIHRSYHAPRDLVWKAWTEADRLKQWFGPKGCPIFSCQLDLSVDGEFLYGMAMPDGSQLWGKWIFKEIAAPERLVFVATFSDPDGNIIRNPWDKNWPLETLSTVTFKEHDGQTTVALKTEPFNATDTEHKTFRDGHQSMNQGWSGTFEQLAEYLKNKNGK